MFAYCGLVGNPHVAAKIYMFAPLSTSTKTSSRSESEDPAAVSKGGSRDRASRGSLWTDGRMTQRLPFAQEYVVGNMFFSRGLKNMEGGRNGEFANSCHVKVVVRPTRSPS